MCSTRIGFLDNHPHLDGQVTHILGEIQKVETKQVQLRWVWPTGPVATIYSSLSSERRMSDKSWMYGRLLKSFSLTRRPLNLRSVVVCLGHKGFI